MDRVKTRTRKRAKWDDDYYVRAYQLAKSGMTDDGVAGGVGVPMPGFKKWVKENASFNKALEEGRKSDAQVQEDYVYDRLSGDARKVWNRIVELDKEKNPVRRIEGLLQQHGEGMRKLLYVHALAKTHFNATQAC